MYWDNYEQMSFFLFGFFVNSLYHVYVGNFSLFQILLMNSRLEMLMVICSIFICPNSIIFVTNFECMNDSEVGNCRS
jgi:hypothetical protein